MGKLAFDLLVVEVVGPDACAVVGRYRLKKEEDEAEASGHFTLMLRRVQGRWVIASDHSS
jgi:ketosteroid isomerase-like protein